MKKNLNVLFGALCALTFFIFASAALCDPPSEIKCSYDLSAKTINIDAVHGSKNIEKHFIESIEIFLGDKSIVKKDYKTQTDSTGQKDTFKIDGMKAGYKYTVKAKCNRIGSKKVEITIEDKQGSTKEDIKKEETEDMLKTGDKAPEFTLKNQKGEGVSLSQFKGKKNVVLIFYPGDSTPGCTKQLCAVRDDFEKFVKADVEVFGVNPQSAESHQKFITKQNFQFSLLIDDEKKTITDYKAGGLLMTKRTVYGINKDGIIVFAQRGMPSNDEILKAFVK